MLEIVTQNLVALPTPTTSPIYLALNTTANKTAMGGVSAIGVYDCHGHAIQAASPVPYVRFIPTSEVVDQKQALGGQGNTQTILVLQVEYVANGTTEYEAQLRARQLRIEVETKLKALQGTSFFNALQVAGPSSTNAYDLVTGWLIKSMPDPVVQGGGTNPTGQKFQAKKYTRLEVMVTYKR